MSRGPDSRSVKIDLKGAIAGAPAFLLRRALRARVGREWSGARLSSDVGVADAAQFLAALEHEGLIERSGEADTWTATIKGNALANARGRRVARATAQRHLDAFLERVKALREEPRFLWRVHRVALFGSFADPKVTEVGDVDLVVELAAKEPNWARHLELEERYRRAERARARRFASFFAELTAPRVDPLRYLKGRSSILSIHDSLEYDAFPMSAFTILYEDPIDEPNRTRPGDFRSPTHDA